MRMVTEYVVVTFRRERLGKQNTQMVIFAVDHGAPLVLLAAGHEKLSGRAASAPHYPAADLELAF